MNALQQTYSENIRKELFEKLDDVSNVYSVPTIKKVVVNVGVGKIGSRRRLSATSKKTEADLVEDINAMLVAITGQKPQVILSKKSIAGFKLRAGNVVGLSVTLRKQRMYDLLFRLIHIGLPRTRDFRGIPEKSVDAEGNLTIGIRDMSIFPETGSTLLSFGCEVTIVVDALERSHALALYRHLGVPFEKKDT